MQQMSDEATKELNGLLEAAHPKIRDIVRSVYTVGWTAGHLDALRKAVAAFAPEASNA